MAWTRVISYLRAFGGRDAVQDDRPRVDDGLPLGARIGGLLQLQQTPMIRAVANGSLIALPEPGDMCIQAVSQLRFAGRTLAWRLYLAKGDGDARERFVQVYGGRADEPSEILYCTRLARVIPETVEDQEAYTGTTRRGLGDSTYMLWRHELADMLDGATLDAVFGDMDHVEYQRDAEPSEPGWIAPYRGRETRIDDAHGMRGLRQELYFMQYSRGLQDGTREYLTITTEIIESVDGNASRRGIHVDFVIGIRIEPERILVG